MTALPVLLVPVISPAAQADALAGSATPAISTTVPPAPAGWTTVWSDDFGGSAGSAPSSSNWITDIGTQYPGGPTQWGTGEVERDTNSSANLQQDGSGHLVMTPIQSAGAWTAARIETQRTDFAAPPGGQLEVSASIQQPNPASGLGYWPAFWILGAGFRGNYNNWPGIGEIDIMEDVNALSDDAGTLHCGSSPGGPCNETTGLSSGLQACAGCQTGYHTYAVIVDRTHANAEQIRWYRDGAQYFSVSESQVGTAAWEAAVDHGFFLILDVAIGGGFPNAVCGCTTPSGSTSSGAGMSVDYVAVYQTPTSVVTTMPPVRLADTRAAGGPIANGVSRCFQVVGVDGIPADAGAIVLNVTAVGQTTNGWLTVYPAGQVVPGTSTLNFGTAEYALANGTIMPVGAAGQVCVNVGTINSVPGSAHVVLDATGFLSSSALSQLPMLSSPVRLADTRISGGSISTGASRCFQVAGVMGIPADAAAIVLNVTAAGYSTQGWLTAYPNGQLVPATSTVNFDPSEYAMANNAIMSIGSDGRVCVNVGTVNSAAGTAQVILDATGYLTAAGLAQMPLLASPRRLVDTRTSSGPIATATSRCFALAGQAGIPANATGLVLNMTAVGYSTPGWLTVYPSGQGLPASSTANFDTSEYAIANGAVVALGSDGQVCVNVGTINATHGSSEVIIDVVGYLILPEQFLV